jgi:hypothetical protein
MCHSKYPRSPKKFSSPAGVPQVVIVFSSHFGRFRWGGSWSFTRFEIGHRFLCGKWCLSARSSTCPNKFHKISKYCPSEIQGEEESRSKKPSCPRNSPFHYGSMQSLKWPAWSRTSPNHVGVSAIQPVWSGWSRKSPAIDLIIKTIAIAKGLANRDQAPVRSILPGCKLSRTPLEGSGIFIILNPI